MYHAGDCSALGLAFHPVWAGTFRGRGGIQGWRIVPANFVISMVERGAAHERFAWGECVVQRGELICLWPQQWHEVSEHRGRPLSTLWLEVAGLDWSALATAFGVSAQAPVVRPRHGALPLLAEIVAGHQAAETLPPAHFYERFFRLAQLCGGALWRPPERRPPSLVERAHAIWHSERLTVLGPAGLAERLGVHPNSLLAAARHERGVTAAQLVLGWKVDVAKGLLRCNDAKIAVIAKTCGFASVSQFTRTFRRLTGRNPGDWRKE